MVQPSDQTTRRNSFLFQRARAKVWPQRLSSERPRAFGNVLWKDKHWVILSKRGHRLCSTLKIHWGAEKKISAFCNFSNYNPIVLGKCQVRRCFVQQGIFLFKIKVSLSLSRKLIAIAMYHGKNAFVLSWRQLWGHNSPSGYKNKFFARVVIISASVSSLLGSKRIESLCQGLQISKHEGIFSLSPQGPTFTSLPSHTLSLPFLCSRSSSLMAEAHSPHQWEGVCETSFVVAARLGWHLIAPVWAPALRGSCTSAGRRDVHMAPPDSGEATLPSRAWLWGLVRKNKKKTKREDLFYQSFTQSLFRN